MKTGMKSPLCEFLVPATCLHLSHAWVNIFPVRMVGDIATRSGQSAECYEWAQWKTPSPCREPKNACLRVINFSLCTEWGTTGITLFFLFLLRLCFEEEKRKNHILRIWEFNMDFFFCLSPLWSILWLIQWSLIAFEKERTTWERVVRALKKLASLLFEWTDVSCLLLALIYWGTIRHIRAKGGNIWIFIWGLPG